MESGSRRDQERAEASDLLDPLHIHGVRVKLGEAGSRPSAQMKQEVAQHRICSA